MKNTITTNQKRLFLAILAAVLLLLAWMLKPYFWPFLIALLLYLILENLYTKLHAALGKRDTLASIVAIILIFIVILLPLGAITGTLAKEAVDISTSLKDRVSIEGLNSFLESDNFITRSLNKYEVDIASLDEKALEYIQKSSGEIFGGVSSALKNAFQLVINLIFTIIFLFFLFKDGTRMKKRFYEILPYPEELEKRVVDRMGKVASDVFYGNIIITFLQGAAIALGLAVFGIPHPVILGLLAGITSLIPVVGTFIVWVPAAIYLLVQGDVVQAVILAAWALLANFVLDNVVKPKILDRKLNLHPILIFFSLLGGLQLFGFVGIILGPLVAVLFISLWEIVRDWNTIKKDLDIEEIK